MKQTIKLTESQLHDVIIESVKECLNEIGDTRRGQYMLGRLHRRTLDRTNQRNREEMKDKAKDIESHRTDRFIKKVKGNKNYVGPFDIGDSDQISSDDGKTIEKHYNMYKKRDERSKK